jgi:hypothetical protein
MPAAFGFNYIAEAIFHIRMERIFHSGANHYFMPPLAAFIFLGVNILLLSFSRFSVIIRLKRWEHERKLCFEGSDEGCDNLRRLVYVFGGCLKTAGPAVAEPAAAESEPRKESPPPASTETPASDDRYTPVPDTAEPKDGELVKVSDFIPTISVDLKYATADNFTETVIYGFSDAYLRYGTVKKLRAVQKAMLGRASA